MSLDNGNSSRTVRFFGICPEKVVGIGLGSAIDRVLGGGGLALLGRLGDGGRGGGRHPCGIKTVRHLGWRPKKVGGGETKGISERRQVERLCPPMMLKGRRGRAVTRCGADSRGFWTFGVDPQVVFRGTLSVKGGAAGISGAWSHICQ